jgi:dynactin-6
VTCNLASGHGAGPRAVLILVLSPRRGIAVMRIGKENHFMIGCREFLSHTHSRATRDKREPLTSSPGVESPSVGDHNAFQPRSRASSAVAITAHCTLGAGTILLPLDPTLPPGQVETIPPYTVVYGAESERRIWDASCEVTEMGLRANQVSYLREVLPK